MIDFSTTVNPLGPPEWTRAIITRELDILRVKGKSEGVLVHEILCKKSNGLDEIKQKLLPFYIEGLSAYKNRRWEDGMKRFKDALAIDENDGPSTVYLGRCNEFLKNPPPENWDGIFTMRTK